MAAQSAGNALRVHERIPNHILPIVYYHGEGKYMLLAKKKSQ